MREFSIGDALGAGFRLIRRRPLAVFAWGFFALVIVALGMMAMGATMGAGAAIGHPERLPEIMQAFAGDQMRMQAAEMPFRIIQLLLAPILTCAVFRAVLEPDNRAFFSLRIGMDELRNLVACIAVGVILGLGIAALALVGVGVWFACGPIPAPWATLVRTVAIIGLGLVGLWACLRMSLAIPLTFAEHRFRIFESWALTKGQSLHLLGLFLLMILVVLAVEIALVLAVVVLAIPLVLLAGHGHSPQTWMDRPVQEWGWVAAVAGVIAVAALSFFIGIVEAVTRAPLADVVRQLRGSGTSAPVHPDRHPEPEPWSDDQTLPVSRKPVWER